MLELQMQFLIIFFLALSVFAEDSFYKAKKALLEYYEKNPEEAITLYCQVPFKVKNNKIIAEEKISFEHIVPISILAKNLPCYKNGGRKACAKDETFKKLEGDLLNIAPALYRINTLRRNYPYGDLNFDNTDKKCKVFLKNKVFYPANASKQKIAKTYLQMAKKYNLNITQKEQEMFKRWIERY